MLYCLHMWKKRLKLILALISSVLGNIILCVLDDDSKKDHLIFIIKIKWSFNCFVVPQRFEL